MSLRLQTVKKVGEMAHDVERLLLAEVKRLIASGGIDLDSDETAPKVLLHVALQNIADQYCPLSSEGKRAARNLLYF